jgi:uncharacterized Fe-S cluster-containing radical SAM superfamily protein
MKKQRDPSSFAVIEPRILHIAKDIQRLLSVVQFEKDGEPVEVDGFRLLDLSLWQDNDIDNALNALVPISGLCNSHCAFCFEQGVPFARELSLMSVEEAHTRLKYYCPTTGKGLFASNRPHMEPFINPAALEILELARRREPDKLFWITTNGSFLEEDVVRRLAALRPLILKLSLNVSDPQLNRKVMKMGKKTDTTINAPVLLEKYQIPFIGSIVAWPTIPLEAIAETVHYLESHRAYAIRIRLPLIHRWYKEQPDIDFNAHWQAVSQVAYQLRAQCEVPLFVEPPIYWVDPIIPVVDGVVLNSPAYHLGVHQGDIIRTINGRPVLTRSASQAILCHAHSLNAPVDLVVERGKEQLQFHLDALSTEDQCYPYDPIHYYRGEAYGIFHVEDFRFGYIRDMLSIIRRHMAKNVLVFSSPVVATVFEAITHTIPEYVDTTREVNITTEVLKKTVLGGNFDLVDGRFVEDFAASIRERLNNGERYDLILIPNAFGGPWGTDLYGQSYTEIATEFGIPVELIDWYLIYGREI